MLNESLTIFANLALCLFVMTIMVAKHKNVKVKPVKLVATPVYGRRLKPGQSDCGQHGE
jgi:hypothetical protein